jgi:hypothetical protein
MSLGLLVTIWMIQMVFVFFWPNTWQRQRLGWVWLLGYLVGVFVLLPSCQAAEKLLLMSVGLLSVVKTTRLLQLEQTAIKQYSLWGLFAYMALWPGVDPKGFQKRETFPTPKIESDAGRRFVRGYVFCWAGFILLILSSLNLFEVSRDAQSWLGLMSLLLMIHLGFSDVLSSVMPVCGWRVRPLFNEPFKSTSLQDFWSHRWNVAFVEMNIQLFVPLCKPLFGKTGTIFAVFLISGLLHEVAISFPVNQGWGSPMLYFLIQGVALFALEPFLKITAQPVCVRRLWTWAWILLPVPLLFHQPFRFELILPLLDGVHGMLTQWSLYQWFDLAIFLAGVGHFCTLLAGTQLPSRLNWKEELAKVSSFNRKIFLNYYATVGLTIIGFGVLTLIFKSEMLSGSYSALCLATLIALFWTMRVLVDFFYFKHEDWPKGFLFVTGHAALTTLFVLMASVYWGLIYCYWGLGWPALPQANLGVIL